MNTSIPESSPISLSRPLCWLTTGILALTLTLVLVSTRWLRLNLSPSLPCGLYRLTAVPAAAEVRRGALVVLPVPASVQHVWPSWIPLLKPVAGVPGDVVCSQEGRLQVNTIDYGPVYLEAHGRALPHLAPGCQAVPAGMVFLASQAAKSLDSRYFGMTPVTVLSAEVTPLLVWR